MTFIKIIVILSVSAVLCSAQCGKLFGNKVPEIDKKTIVDVHNDFRQMISDGKVPGQPRGKNLKKIVWDVKLAKEAQKIANLCVFNHVDVKDYRFHAVGQNLGWTGSTASTKGADWRKIIQIWFDEHKDFIYPDGSKGVTGHYTQVVWANTSRIGCGFTWYRKGFWYEKLYVCNYGPAGNYVGQAPYPV